MVKSAVILLGGARTIPDIAQDDIVICADSGYLKALEASVKVDHLVGDMDSTPPDIFNQALGSDIAIHRYSSDKDLSDGEIALRLALDLGCKSIVLSGGSDGRTDHIVSTLLLPFISEEWTHLEIYIGNTRSIFMRKGMELTFDDKHEVVSLIPLSGNSRVTTAGLKWELTSEYLELGSTRGIHNMAEGGPFTVQCEDGHLLVIFTDEE